MDQRDEPPAEESHEGQTPTPEPPAAVTPARRAADDDVRLQEEWERWQQTVRERRRLREQQQQEEGTDIPSPAARAAQTRAPAADGGGETPAVMTATDGEGGVATTDGEGEGGAAQPGAGARWRRAADAAAAVGESFGARAEKLRDASVYVLEEPPDDSGLSFVLLAAGLFLLFLFFLFLSTVLK